MSGRRNAKHRAGDSADIVNNGYIAGPPVQGGRPDGENKPDGAETQVPHSAVPPSQGVDLEEAFTGFIAFLSSRECTTALKNARKLKKLLE